MKTRIIVLTLTAAIGLSLTALPAYAAQSNADVDSNVATRGQLEAIVGPQVKASYKTVEGTVTNVVTDLVRSVVGNPAAVKATVKPLLQAAVKSQLAQYNIANADVDQLIDTAIDTAVDNQIVDAVLTNEFVQAVINRAIGYAVADIVAQLGIAEDEAAATASLVNSIWGAPLQTAGNASTKLKGHLPAVCAAGGCANPTYYNFSVVSWNSLFGIKTTPKEIRVSGWNTTAINTYVTGSTLVSVGGQLGVYQARLANMDYTSIIAKAVVRAAQDEIRERVQAFVLKVKTAALDRLTAELAKINVTVELEPTDTLDQIGQSLLNGLVNATHAQIQSVLNGLCQR